MNPDDYPYCPRCKEGKYKMDVEMGLCTDCGTEVREEWPRTAQIMNATKSAAGLLFGVGILFGPFLLAAYRIVRGLLRGEPLVGWHTVEVTKTVTRPTGVLNEAVPLVLIGVIVWVVVFYMMYGPRAGRL
jgi:hypothetical protein